MKTKAPKEAIKPSVLWQCPNCPEKPEFDSNPAFVAHIKEVHKLDNTRGKRSLVMHLDCADSFHNTYEWEIAGLKFHQSTSNPRQKNDPMRFNTD